MKRTVLELNAINKKEALDALDMVRKIIEIHHDDDQKYCYRVENRADTIQELFS